MSKIMKSKISKVAALALLGAACMPASEAGATAADEVRKASERAVTDALASILDDSISKTVEKKHAGMASGGTGFITPAYQKIKVSFTGAKTDVKVKSILGGVLFKLNDKLFVGVQASHADAETELDGVSTPDSDINLQTYGITSTLMLSQSENFSTWATGKFNYTHVNEKNTTTDVYTAEVGGNMLKNLGGDLSLTAGAVLDVNQVAGVAPETWTTTFKTGLKYSGEHFQPVLQASYRMSLEEDASQFFAIGPDVNWAYGPHKLGAGYSYTTLVSESTGSNIKVDTHDIHATYRFSF
ncbi:MAG: hypothetical protein HQL70_09295 [Magnetococcales bacterium]|nr:hypothetical protein [Magnetococcales bacterium]